MPKAPTKREDRDYSNQSNPSARARANAEKERSIGNDKAPLTTTKGVNDV